MPQRIGLDVRISNGRLTQVGQNFHSSVNRISAVFECSCGRRIVTQCTSVKNGKSLSCGCLIKEVTRKRSTTHGMAPRKGRSSEYRIWAGIVTRCTNPRNAAYRNYGKRGITICDRWLVFENFYSDMGTRPKGLTVERKDNSREYSKENCEWASQKDQSRNRRGNRVLTANGKTQCVAAWAEETGIGVGTIQTRLKYKWSDEDAVNTLVGAKIRFSKKA